MCTFARNVVQLLNGFVLDGREGSITIGYRLLSGGNPMAVAFIVGVVVTPKNEKGIRAIILRGDRRLSLDT